MNEDFRKIGGVIADYALAYASYRSGVLDEDYDEEKTDKLWDKLVTAREIMDEALELLVNPWQPLESAPKEADGILLGNSEGDLAIAYWGHPCNAMNRDYAWCDESTDHAITWATHWKRKPAAPSKE